jgi:hypothetical protein
MDNKVNLTVLEEIIKDISVLVYDKWSKALPDDQKTPQALETLQKNSSEYTLFIVQNFINKFNEAAEELKDQPE